MKRNKPPGLLPPENRLLIVRFYNPKPALQAYRWLQQHHISPEHFVLLGQRFSSLRLTQVLHPWRFISTYQSPLAQQLSILGAALGIGLFFTYLATELDRLSRWLGIVVAGLLGGSIGAVSGQSLVWGWALLKFQYYQRLLKRGNLLLLIEGSPALVADAARLLRKLQISTVVND